MLFLVDEMYKNRNKTFTIKIGKPIPWQTFDRSRSDQEWAAYVREKVYQLWNILFAETIWLQAENK